MVGVEGARQVLFVAGTGVMTHGVEPCGVLTPRLAKAWPPSNAASTLTLTSRASPGARPARERTVHGGLVVGGTVDTPS